MDDVFNPFPGLRPFEPDEDYLFFGRGEHTDELLRRLRQHRFLTVIGSSGSGKSSLVRAGLLPALYGGFMVAAGSDWRVAVLRPGSDPIGNLARALREPEVLEDQPAEGQDGDLDLAFARATLARSRQGLVQVVREARLSPGTSLLVLVDQFEELFRFRSACHDKVSDEATAFVDLLLTAAAQEALPIYLVLTMRSDFLGDCAQFHGLPEAINAGEYLVPRLERRQREQAIAGPIGVGGAELSRPLLQRLLADMGDDSDQLPVFQHALMRTFDHWLAVRQGGEPIQLEHYEAIGGMQAALSRHAEEALEPLSERERGVAERVLKALTEEGGDGRQIRRPTTLSDLSAITGAVPADVVRVVEHFRAPARAFLRPTAEQDLTNETVIDLSHESLMRVWGRLAGWVREEGRAVSFYSHLSRTAAMHATGEAALWRPPELQLALALGEEINQAWAERRAPGTFEQAMGFVEASRRSWQAEVAAKEAARRRAVVQARLVTALTLGALVLALVFAVVTWRKNAAIEEQSAGLRSRQLALLAEDQTLIDHDRSLLLAIEAAHARPSLEAERTLRHWMLRPGRTLRLMRGHDAPVVGIVWDPAGDRLLSVSHDFSAGIWDAERGVLLHRLVGHGEKLWHAAWSPDGKRVATASLDETARIWDATTGAELHRLEGHNDLVRHLAWNGDGDRLATVGYDRMARIWDTATGAQLVLLAGHTDFLVEAVWRGDRLATASFDQTVRVWDTLSGHELNKVVASSSLVRDLAWGSDGLAIGSDDGSVYRFDADGAAGAQELAGHIHPVMSVDLHPAAPGTSRHGWLAAGVRDGSVWIWNRQGRTEAVIADRTRPVVRVAWRRDGALLAVAREDGTVSIHDTERWNRVALLTGHRGPILDLMWHPDGHRIATAGADGHVRVYDPAPGTEAPPLDFGGTLHDAAWSPDGHQIAMAGEGGRLHLVPVDGQGSRQELTGHRLPVRDIAWSHSGQRLATASRRVILWDPGTGEIVVELAAHTAPVTSLNWRSDDRFLVSTSRDRLAIIWDVASGQPVHTLRGHGAWVHHAAWSPDGQTIATGSDDGDARLWNAETGAPISVLKGHSSAVRHLAWRPDGKVVATGGTDRTIRLFDTATGVERARLTGHSDWVMWVAWNSDGKVLASAGKDGRTILWDAERGRIQRIVEGHDGAVRQVAWSANDERLLTVSDDGTARLWRAADGWEVAVIRGHGDRIVRAAWNDHATRLFAAGRDGLVDLSYSHLDDLITVACGQSVRELDDEEWQRYMQGAPRRPTCPSEEDAP